MEYIHHVGIIVVVFSIILGVGSNNSLVMGFDRPSQEAILATINTAAFGITLQSDNKVVVAGTAGTHFAVARYNPDGSLDLGFDEDGKVTTSFGINAAGSGVAIQPDEKIVVAGTAGTDFALARYYSDGSLDTGFGNDGKVTTSFGSKATGSDIVIQPDGKIVIVGTAGTDIALVRYNPDGTLDLGFDGNGKVTTSFGTNAAGSGVVIQPDGKIVVAGTVGPNNATDFAIVRYNSDGSLDFTFGSDGKVVTNLDAMSDSGNAITLQPDNKIVVAGSKGIYFGTMFTLLRYNPDGSLDPYFGDNGIVITSLAGEYDWAYAVTIQPDDKIIAAGDRHLLPV